MNEPSSRNGASAVLAERYLYLPSVAVVGLVALGLAALRPRARAWRAAVVACALAIVLGGAMAIQRTAVWADNLAFWGDTAVKTPDSALVRRELADASLAAGRIVDA